MHPPQRTGSWLFTLNLLFLRKFSGLKPPKQTGSQLKGFKTGSWRSFIINFKSYFYDKQ